MFIEMQKSIWFRADSGVRPSEFESQLKMCDHGLGKLLYFSGPVSLAVKQGYYLSCRVSYQN